MTVISQPPRRMSTEKKLLFWSGGILVFFLFLYLVRSVLLPFVVGMGLAYFLQPLVVRLERLKIPHFVAVLLILALFFVLAVGGMMVLLPPLYEQAVSLLAQIPYYLQGLRSQLDPLVAGWLDRIDTAQIEQVRSSLGKVGGNVLAIATKLVGEIWQGGMAMVSVLSLLFITPIVAFYLLRDWKKMVEKVDTLLPRHSAPVIREQLQAIDRTLAGYIRGQTNVCLILATYYAVALTVVGLNYSLLIGVAAGLLAFLPYVGVMFGMGVGLAVAWFQFDGDLVQVGYVLGIFLVAQFVEGNFITPRIVGESVGLHPAWLIFGMLAGGALFGFVGILLAVPVTAVAGVLVRFAVKEYLDSPFYLEGGGKKA